MAAERFKLVAVVYLMLRRGNEILLSMRQNTGFADGQYSLVAGHLDGDEPATLALCREAKEEAGIDLNPQDLKLALTMHGYDPGREAIDLFFVADKWQGEVTNAEPHKCGGLQFFPVDKLPAETVPYIRDAVAAVQNGVNYIEDGWN